MHKFKKELDFVRPLLGMLLVLLVACLSYANSLGLYYFCDDFNLISFCHQACFSDKALLTKPFFHPIEECQKYLLSYRPLPFEFLIAEYAVFGKNPAAYHLSNLFLYALDCIALFFYLSGLLKLLGAKKYEVIALVSALFFASYPLHCEVVPWVIGTFELLCFLFFVLTLLVCLSADGVLSVKQKVCGAVLMVLALLSKEHAYILPFLLFCQGFLLSRRETLWSRLTCSLQQVLVFFAILVCICALRWSVLGTAIGGYYGVAKYLVRTFEGGSFVDKCLVPILFPFNRELLSSSDLRIKVLAAAYWLFICKILLFRIDATVIRPLLKAALLLLIWGGAESAIVAQVFCINGDLSGARHFYNASASYLALIALVIWIPSVDNVRYKGWRLSEILSCIISLLFISDFCVISQVNTGAFQLASRTIEAFQRNLIQVLGNLTAGDRIVLLNPPQKERGVHLIYHPEMLDAMLSAPFAESPLHERLVIPSKFMFLSEDLISVSQLRFFESQNLPIYCWDTNRLKLFPLKNLPHAEKPFQRTLRYTGTANKQGWTCFEFAAEPNDLKEVDFVRVRLKCSLPSTGTSTEEARMALRWKSKDAKNTFGQLGLPLRPDGDWHAYDFSVSESKRWLLSPPMDRVEIAVPQDLNPVISELMVLSDHGNVPILRAAKGTRVTCKSGVYEILGSGSSIDFDVLGIPDATGSVLEISKPNMIFEIFDASYRTASGAKFIQKTFNLGCKGSLLIDNLGLRPRDIYEIRLRAKRADGSSLGYYSDPMFLRIVPQ